MPSTYSLIINAGGQSRRMGQVKALLPVPPNNHPLISHILHRLQPLNPSKTIIVTNNNDIQKAIPSDKPIHLCTDAYPDAGALGGIATGLAHCADWGIFVACDMPLLNPSVLRYLYQLTQGREAKMNGWDAIIPVVNGRQQSLHALYHHRCLPTIEKKIKAGQLRVTSFYSDLSVRFVDEAELRPADPHLHTFFNANTPSDWAFALNLLEKDDSIKS